MGRSDEYKSGRVSSVIGKKTEIQGKLIGHELLRIDGLVNGIVESEGRVIVGNGGKVVGEIHAKEIFVGGTVEGEIYSTGRVEANPTGKIFGDIHTPVLIVDEKAIFEGRCEMTQPEVVEINQ